LSVEGAGWRSLVVACVRRLGEQLERPELASVDEDSRLYGDTLDSLGIVMLATELEDELSEHRGIDVTIVDERAMSRKTSPFLSVRTLARYLEELAGDAAGPS
jgi:acyl carrier protein